MAETVAHVVGARPNFMKAAPVIRGLAARSVPQVVIHTGQHYDDKMSDVFFRDLGLPEPDLNLGVGSGTHAGQTAALMVELERAFAGLDPALVVVYGDINSTLAAAVVAAKLGRPIAHVEAGLRSFDRTMPEEINRVVTDVLADLLFTTSPEAETNLVREGIDPGRIHFVGNPMIDTLLANLDRFDVAAARSRLGLEGRYGVATLHRPANVDDAATAGRVVAAVRGVAELVELVIPLHPRGRATLEAAGLGDDPRIHVVDPLGYVEFMSLVRGAAVVVTDSGGIQEETTILGVPCLTLRPNTERPITISHGTNRLVEPDGVVAAARAVLDGSVPIPTEAPPLWDGAAGAADRRDRRALAGRPGRGPLGRDRVSSRGALRPACPVRGAGRATPASPVTGLGGPMTEDRRLAVIGLGYVGLPLAISFVEAGLEVEGVDAHSGRVAELSAGRSPIDDIPDSRLTGAIAAGMRVVGTDAAHLADADVIFVCVPTPIDQAKDPDLGPVLSAAELIRRHLRKGQLVILQSTTFPGTTTGPFRKVLEQSGFMAGRDFDLAFAPERVNPGDPASAAKDVPRLVGATTPEATIRAATLLRRINNAVIELSSPDAAELAKLLENIFRNVNIALVNQLALLCERMGLDVWEVIGAAATKPFGFMRFTPGPGVGGHCIPVDPYYLAWRAREFDFVDRFVELAGDINYAMPRHVVDLVAEGLNDRGKALKGARVGVLGVAFKPDVRDARNAPAAAILAGLAARGADVSYHDPHVPRFRDTDGAARDSIEIEGLLRRSDAVVVVTPHKAIDWEHVYATAGLVIDTVDSSHGRTTTDRQVLRLGAGWTVRA